MRTNIIASTIIGNICNQNRWQSSLLIVLYCNMSDSTLRNFKLKKQSGMSTTEIVILKLDR